MEQVYLQAPGPYTQPEKLPRNIRYARILLSAMSGPESELTATHQYIYHHVMAERELPEAADILKGIAIVEMHHLDMLAGTINMLGLRPCYGYYQGTRRVRWNSGYVEYGKNLKDMLSLDLEGEKRAIESYSQMIRCIPEESIQQLLRRIIEDEETHVVALTRLLECL